MSTTKVFTNATGAPVADNTNIMTAGRRGPALLQDVWLIEKLAQFDREVIPERRMHAKGWGAYGTFTVTHDITRFTKAKIFATIGKQTPLFVRFSSVAGERGAADAERDIRGTAVKFYTEEGNWDIVGNNTPVFFFRDPLRFSDLNHAIKRDPRTGLRSADNNWDFWTLLPEALHQVTIVMSDRGIPKSFRHMHLFGSHTFSMINAANERVWVKFHFRTQQGIQNLTDAEAAAVVAKDRESNGRDLLTAIDTGDFPRWTVFIQVMTEAAFCRSQVVFEADGRITGRGFVMKGIETVEFERGPGRFDAIEPPTNLGILEESWRDHLTPAWISTLPDRLSTAPIS